MVLKIGFVCVVVNNCHCQVLHKIYWINMFGLRIFKRNKLSTLRLVAVLVSFCLILLLMTNIKTSPELKDLDLESVSREKSSIVVFTDDVSNTKGKIVFSTNSDPFSQVHFKVPEASFSESNMQYGQSSLVKQRKTVNLLNQDQKILNVDKFPNRSSDSIVIVVQVHKRAKYLIKLIQSLRNTRGISDALLIVSHDYFASEINGLVRSIDFCQVIQIYFPYSEQLYPDEFPGTDPKDCPRDAPKQEAMARRCKNADHPDMYGHYREAKFTMTKHHWWWKANRVFQALRSTRNHQGLVLFLEEDHYVSPDFYEVLQKSYSMKKTSIECQEHGCDILTLGDYQKISNLQDAGSNILLLKPWESTKNNMGMAFDRNTWNKISECNKLFCTYDDYNWDWTLLRMSLVCLKKPLTVLLVKAPRVFHLGACGLHHKSGNCDVETSLALVKDLIKNSASHLYPNSLVIKIAQPWIKVHMGPPNGGWGDTRDHQLCLQFAKSTEK